MAYFSFNKSLDRRTFLKSTGAAVALPFLSAMQPAFSKSKNETSPRRFMAINAGLGYHTEFLFPETPGRDYKLTPYLEIIKNHRSKFTVISGTSHPQQNGNNGHASGMTLLTSAKRPGLAGFKNTVSIDQLIASHIGAATRYPYLSAGTSGSLSWTANGVAIPADNSPVRLYKKLFVNGTEHEIQKQIKDLARGKSILDTIKGPASKLKNELGTEDKEKLAEYMASIRDLEVRLKQNREWVKKPKPQVDFKYDKDPEKLDVVSKLDMYYKLIEMALKTDSSRSITFNIGGMNAIPKINGVKTDWHNLSHHGKDETKINELKLIETEVFKCFNRFLNAIDSHKEKGGSILDQTAIFFTSNLGNASSHNWRNLPVIVAGGNFKHGSYIAYDEQKNEHLANLFVQMGNYMGLNIDRFGSSNAASLKGFS